jgi:2-oxoglutarate ferredoxin oxidoreductase subunit gamma
VRGEGQLEFRVIIAGFGGQGILFMGKVFATAAMGEGKEVTVFPSYGAEVRGGTANCTVVLSDEMIGSPVVEWPDALIAMSEASVARFLPKVKPRGLLIYDSSLVTSPLSGDVRAFPVPASELAADLKNTRSANMVILGAFTAATAAVKMESVMEAVIGLSDGRMNPDGNKKAIETGWSYFEDKKSKNPGPKTRP